jgi:protein-disulfide isomerase
MNRLPNIRHRFTAVVVTAGVIGTAMIAVSQISARGDNQTPASTLTTSSQTPRASAASESLFSGIRQRGATLGSPAAPVTLVEYADLQCPYCADWARETLPVLVRDYVRGGKLRIVFKGLAFIGPDSDKALRTAVAAGRQDHLWELVHGLYARQEGENTGWVSDALVQEIAADSDLDGDKLLEERWSSYVETEIKEAAASAQAAGVQGTPSFEIGPTGGRLQLKHVSSLGTDGIVPTIEAELRR